jgi:acetylornithine deacetylase
MPDFEHAIRAYLDDQIERIADTLAQLVRIPTVNPYSGDPHPAGEVEGQRFLRERMREAGGETALLPVPADIYRQAGILGPRERAWEGRENLVGRFSFGDGSGDTVVLNGHMDTIGVSDFDGEPFTGWRDGDIVHGRGASDCKGGLVAGLFALEALRAADAPLRCQVLFESVVDEECNGGGAGTLACCLGGVSGRYCLVLDGSYGLLYTGCQGVATVEVTVRGRAGHGSMGGVSAVEKLLVVKRALDQLSAERARTHPGFHVNVGVLRAGLAPWVVPSHGWLTANINYTREEVREGPGCHGTQVRERLETLIAEVCHEDEWLRGHAPEVVWVKDLPPFGIDDTPNRPDSDRLVAAAREAFTTVTGNAPNTGDLHAWGDAAHLARTGRMPVVGMGAGEPGTAHTSTEYNRLGNVRDIAAAVALTILRLDGRAGEP